MKGGYQIISLHNVSLFSDTAAVTISGIYEAIEGNYGKALLLSDIMIGGVEKPSVFLVAEASVNKFAFKNFYGGTLTITSDDEVTLTTATEA